MGFMNTLAGLGLVEKVEENPATQNKTAILSSSPSENVNSVVDSASAAPLNILEGSVDSKFIKHLMDLMDKANLPGPDYYEFRKSLDTTSTTQASIAEPVRYQMTYAILSASAGELTKKVLIDSSQKYLEILSKENADYQLSVENKLTEQVAKREKQLEAIVKENNEKALLIEKLSKEIQENQLKSSSIQGEITTEKSKIEQNRRNFDVSYQTVVKQIADDIAKIEQYLV